MKMIIIVKIINIYYYNNYISNNVDTHNNYDKYYNKYNNNHFNYNIKTNHNVNDKGICNDKYIFIVLSNFNY